jgi:PhnB protein
VNAVAIEAYINFKGNCREAVEYYSQVFKTEKPKFMTFGDMPQGLEAKFVLPDNLKGWIMHTQLTIHGSILMFSDVFPDMPFTVGNNISLVIVSGNKEELEQSFSELKAGGTVKMELQETFWSKCYGFITDKFGVNWQFSLR